MPKFQVVRALEHNSVLYLPAGPGLSHQIPDEAFGKNKSGEGKTFKSAGHGQLVAVNESGFVDLAPGEAERLLSSRVVVPLPKKEKAGKAQEAKGQE